MRRRASHPDRHYVGATTDIHERLRWHNTGPSGVAFERSLKTGSGRAFAKWPFDGV